MTYNMVYTTAKSTKVMIIGIANHGHAPIRLSDCLSDHKLKHCPITFDLYNARCSYFGRHMSSEKHYQRA